MEDCSIKEREAVGYGLEAAKTGKPEGDRRVAIGALQ